MCRSRSDFVLFTTTRQSIPSPARKTNSENLRERSPYNRGWRRVAPSSVGVVFTMFYLSVFPCHINKGQRHTFCHRICRRFHTATLPSQAHARIYLTSDHQSSSSLKLKVISSNLMWNCFLIFMLLVVLIFQEKQKVPVWIILSWRHSSSNLDPKSSELSDLLRDLDHWLDYHEV
jgi:hypothetical protein